MSNREKLESALNALNALAGRAEQDKDGGYQVGGMRYGDLVDAASGLRAVLRDESDRKRRGERSDAYDGNDPSGADGYAYRYRHINGGTVLRFNHGEEVNGSKPIEAVPFWFAPPNATTVTCQLYGHPLKTCAECNHELACPAEPVSVPSDEVPVALDNRRNGLKAGSRLYAAPQPQQHPDDAAVDAFSSAMKAKLAKKRAEGRGGWQSCGANYLSELLREHVEKGDPVDVANLAMMLHQNGHSIQPALQPQQKEGESRKPASERIIGEIKLDERRHPYARLRTGYDENGDQWKDGTPFYAAPQPQQQAGEVLGETCIDGGKCHHECKTRCFRRECCEPFSDYRGPWKYATRRDTACSAIQMSDSMVCHRCQLLWDMDDPCPPDCERALEPKEKP